MGRYLLVTPDDIDDAMVESMAKELGATLKKYDEQNSNSGKQYARYAWRRKKTSSSSSEPTGKGFGDKKYRVINDETMWLSFAKPSMLVFELKHKYKLKWNSDLGVWASWTGDTRITNEEFISYLESIGFSQG